VFTYHPLPDYDLHILGPSKKSRAGIGEKEKNIILECYNKCNGKEWKEVVETARQKIGEKAASMPRHMVNLYLTQTNECLTRRMQNIVKGAMHVTVKQPNVSESVEIGTEQQLLVSNKTRYSKEMELDERRTEAVRLKLNQNFLDSSSSEDESTSTAAKKKIIIIIIITVYWTIYPQSGSSLVH